MNYDYLHTLSHSPAQVLQTTSGHWTRNYPQGERGEAAVEGNISHHISLGVPHWGQLRALVVIEGGLCTVEEEPRSFCWWMPLSQSGRLSLSHYVSL